jgi:hypothetical protein
MIFGANILLRRERRCMNIQYFARLRSTTLEDFGGPIPTVSQVILPSNGAERILLAATPIAAQSRDGSHQLRRGS